LKRQRIETGTDWLNDNNMTALKAYEEKLINNKRFIADKLRMFASIQIDNGKFKTGWELLRQALSLAPGYGKNYKTLMYLLRSMVKNKSDK